MTYQAVKVGFNYVLFRFCTYRYSKNNYDVLYTVHVPEHIRTSCFVHPSTHTHTHAHTHAHTHTHSPPHTHTADIHVPYSGEVRLSDVSSGTLELYSTGHWNGVCFEDNFGQSQATAVCRQLGYTGASSYRSAIGSLRNLGTFEDEMVFCRACTRA